MQYENKFLEIDYTRYGDTSSASSVNSKLTDKVIAKGLVKYLKRYYTWDGKWTNINTSGSVITTHDFFKTAGIMPRRFYEIFKETERTEQFLNYFKDFKVKAEKKPGFLTLIDLEHPKNKKS